MNVTVSYVSYCYCFYCRCLRRRSRLYCYLITHALLSSASSHYTHPFCVWFLAGNYASTIFSRFNTVYALARTHIAFSLLLNLSERDLSGKIAVLIRIQFIVMCYNNYEINGRNLSCNHILYVCVYVCAAAALSVEPIFGVRVFFSSFPSLFHLL